MEICGGARRGGGRRWSRVVAPRSWGRCLDVAGVRGHELRQAYGWALRWLRRREPALVVAVRALAPAWLQPHAVAGYAFGAYSDDLCDRGPEQVRRRRFDAWATRVGRALDGGPARHPLLRAYLCSARVRELPRRWVESYLAGAREDLAFAGFATEADYQDYVDRLSWPFLMLTAGLLHPGGGGADFAASCRALADGCQRTDILVDLAPDLAEGRLCLPAEALARHGVDDADLARGRATPEVGALVAATARAAREALVVAAGGIALVPRDVRPLHRAALLLHHQRLDAITAAGAGVTRGQVRDSHLRCLGLLALAHRPLMSPRHTAVPEPA